LTSGRSNVYQNIICYPTKLIVICVQYRVDKSNMLGSSKELMKIISLSANFYLRSNSK